jgi:hypothetical protein
MENVLLIYEIIQQYLHKIEEGFGEIGWNERLGSMPRVYIRILEYSHT